VGADLRRSPSEERPAVAEKWHLSFTVSSPSGGAHRAQADTQCFEVAATSVRSTTAAQDRPEGQKLYALRKQILEPVFGIIKSVMDFRQFLLRGIDNVRSEWNLATMAWNMRRISSWGCTLKPAHRLNFFLYPK
jgi:hypothetical protein